MKRILLVSVTLFTCIAIIAQPRKTTPKSSPAKNNQHLNAFNLALASGDINTATVALNYYVAEQGGNSIYGDTLAMLYMQLGAFPQCFYWANKRLLAKPDDNGLLEMKGISLDKMQQPKEAIDVFEKLFKKTQSPYHAYKLMELQYGIKRLAECLATAQAAEKLQYKPEMIMTYNVGEQVGRTYLQAGIFNIHALALYDLDKKPEAKTYFEKALALDSNFVLARQNIEAMKAAAQADNKLNPANPNTPVSPANKNN